MTSWLQGAWPYNTPFERTIGAGILVDERRGVAALAAQRPWLGVRPHMSQGKAHGVDRQYQMACRDVLTHRNPELAPWSGDGIDVPFNLPDTTWTFDVALKAPDGSAVVAECRRTVGAVKQGDVAEFAFKVESLRRTIGKSVSAFFFAKTAHQLGAVRVGQYWGVEVALLDEDARPPGFNLTFLGYDAKRDRKLRRIIMHTEPGQVRLTGFDATLTHVEGDGSSESR
ncbi:MAG: hypothetical protein ACRD1X_11490 [Vicinamibacteria bacterium]